MFSYWTNYDRNLAQMDQFRRLMSRMFEDFDGRDSFAGTGDGWFAQQWPRTNVWDTGAAIVIKAEIPGLTEKDVKLSFHDDVLTLSGERKLDTPEGYAMHRQERSPVKFSRSFNFPMRVSVEKATADVKNGVLTVTLPKTPESQPREIAVKAS